MSAVDSDKPGRRTGGYSKGDITREAILRAAIEAFGRSGYQAVTTRQIAAAAGVNQPAINYHFGGKEGLYRACAEEILNNFVGPLQTVSLEAFEALRDGLDRPGAARQLCALMSALADVMILSEEVSEAAGFVNREMREPGIAYRHLFDNLWAPGIDLASRLVAATKGRQDVDESDRVDAIMMVSGIGAFVPGLSVSMEIMRWQSAGLHGRALVMSRLEAQIEGWLRSCESFAV